MRLRISSFFGVVLLICCINLAKAGVSDEVLKLAEEFRARMCHPFPQWNLPALDPFEIEHEEFNSTHPSFKNFTASVTDLRATGLSDFIINEVKLSAVSRKIKLNITFPLTEVKSKYIAKGSLGDIVNLVGDDNLSGRIKDVQIVVTANIKIGLRFRIKDLKIVFGIGELFVDMGKLMEIDRLNNFIHNLINDLTIELLGDFWEDYGDSLTKKVENIINEKMSDYSLTDIIGMISGSGEPIFGDDPPGDCKKNIELSLV